MKEITLTVAEILNLCDFVGITTDSDYTPDELKVEFTIYDGSYGPMVCISDYPENGSLALAEEFNVKNKSNSKEVKS